MKVCLTLLVSNKKRVLGLGGLLLSLMIPQVNGMVNDTATSDGKKYAAIKKERNANGIHAHITTDDSIRHMVNHPAFEGFGRYLVPWDNGTSDYDRPLNGETSQNVCTLILTGRALSCWESGRLKEIVTVQRFENNAKRAVDISFRISSCTSGSKWRNCISFGMIPL